MAADYAVGGWAKLDQRAAYEISEYAATFRRDAARPYLYMLLTLYSSMGQDGTVRIGFKELAHRCGVNERAARRFMDRLKEDGVLVQVDSKRRRFRWIGEGAYKQAPSGAPYQAPRVPISQSEEAPMGAYFPEGTGTLQKELTDYDGRGSATRPLPPVNTDADGRWAFTLPVSMTDGGADG